jgi:hypothetical protein
MTVQSHNTGITTLGTGSEWAIETLRTTGTNLFEAGMFSRRDLAAQELSIANFLALQSTVQQMDPTAVKVSHVPQDGVESGPAWAIATLRNVYAARFNAGMLSLRDVAKLELRIASFEALEALASLLSIDVPKQCIGLDWASDTLRRTMRNRIEGGVATTGDLANLELTLAEVRLRELVA